MKAKPFLFIVLVCPVLHAQGLLPPQASTQTATSPAPVHNPLVIGDETPASLTVTNGDGERRTLLSYKSPVEVLVVTFLSTRCQVNDTLWFQFKRLSDDYTGWRVSFVAVNTLAPDQLPELSKVLKKENIPWPAVQDEEGKLVSLFKITGTPELLIFDESGILRYRGPLMPARKALDALIGHIDPIRDPEPPLDKECLL